MRSPRRPGALPLTGVGLLLVALLPALVVSPPPGDPSDRAPGAVPLAAPAGQVPVGQAAARPRALAGGEPRHELPLGGYRIFPDHILVAYYGTATTPAMGVLGEHTPDRITRRLRATARPYGGDGRTVQIVYELIVTIADATPGADGDYSHDIARADVRRYVEAARRNGALLLLDIQPGRSDFLEVATRWQWALEEPHVGLALDPEWRMHRTVPGTVIGSVSAYEVNRTARWLSQLTKENGLPEKLFVLHQFRTSMIENIGRIGPRANLAMVQHVDGFGTPGQKRATYRTVARPRQFAMGFKLFYDEDRPRMGSAEVHRLRPDVRFVSFQ